MREVSAPSVVYVNKHGDTNEELRYSLRSLAKNLPHADVWIAGYTPRWVRDVCSVPVPQTAAVTKYGSSTANLRAAVEHPGLPDDCLLFNDDFFILTPVSEVPFFNRGSITDVAHMHLGQGYNGPYVAGMLGTQLLLQGLGVNRPLSFELHVPLPFSKIDMLKALDVCAVSGLQVPHKRSVYGNLFGGPSVETHDVKVIRQHDPPVHTPFISTNTLSFKGQTGDLIRRLFPEPCRYERG